MSLDPTFPILYLISSIRTVNDAHADFDQRHDRVHVGAHIHGAVDVNVNDGAHPLDVGRDQLSHSLLAELSDRTQILDGRQSFVSGDSVCQDDQASGIRSRLLDRRRHQSLGHDGAPSYSIVSRAFLNRLHQCGTG